MQTPRDFLKLSVGAAARIGFPTIVPASVFAHTGRVLLV
jgi:hypothetical protein